MKSLLKKMIRHITITTRLAPLAVEKRSALTLFSRVNITLFSLVILSSQQSFAATDELKSVFDNPPAQAKPFARCWWNGNCVRYDFYQSLVTIFNQQFVETFHDWANEHSMKSRYQAYGAPWLVGISEGNMLVDIPESNNWLFRSPEASWFWSIYEAY